MNIIAGSQVFYNVHRQQISAFQSESSEDFIKQLDNSEDMDIIVHKVGSEGQVRSATFIFKKVGHSPYCHDIAIIDDTSSTNIYELPLEAITVIDQEDHTQLLASCILENRTISGFQNFFADVSNTTGITFRIIVMDRSEAQYTASCAVFPDSYIVFCLTHDLVHNFGATHQIVQNFDKMRNNIHLYENYISFITEEREKLINSESKGEKALELLINQRKHWLPSDLLQNGINFPFSSSRIEGLFGVYKQNYGHQRH